MSNPKMPGSTMSAPLTALAGPNFSAGRPTNPRVKGLALASALRRGAKRKANPAVIPQDQM